MKGTVFDIQRFGLHDGPGIRTVFFLKGCPLRCAWCCNPESISPKPQLAYLENKCDACRQCVPACQHGVFRIDGQKVQVDYPACELDTNCIKNCPKGALKIYGEEKSTDEVIKIVEKDMPYYDNSGGGVTLSGGDPVFQPDFSLEILKKAKEKGIHTVIETSGHAPTEIFKKLPPFTDLFLYDYKISDEALHVKYTSKSNKLIKKNLEYLREVKQPVHLRCIIVPGINDDYKHFQAIADLSRDHENIRQVEIMPYHDFGRSKYKEIGWDYTLDIETMEKNEARKYVQQLKSMGGKNIKLG